MSCGPQEGQQLEVRLLQRPGLSNGSATIPEKGELDKRHHRPRETFQNLISAWNSGLWGDGNETYEKNQNPKLLLNARLDCDFTLLM